MPLIPTRGPHAFRSAAVRSCVSISAFRDGFFKSSLSETKLGGDPVGRRTPMFEMPLARDRLVAGEELTTSEG